MHSVVRSYRSVRTSIVCYRIIVIGAPIMTNLSDPSLFLILLPPHPPPSSSFSCSSFSLLILLPAPPNRLFSFVLGKLIIVIIVSIELRQVGLSFCKLLFDVKLVRDLLPPYHNISVYNIGKIQFSLYGFRLL